MDRISLYLSDPQLEHFRKVATRLDISLSAAIRRALDESMLRDDDRLIKILQKRRLEKGQDTSDHPKTQEK